MPKFIQRQTLQQVLQNQTMKEIVKYEPKVRRILAIAADPTPRENRWEDYEELKRLSHTYVGWDARHPQLTSEDHHVALMNAFDLLLPIENVDDQTEAL
jgi:hypothetical protein